MLSISARMLADLVAPWHCPRCWWIKTKVKKLPFQGGFPGVVSSLDAYEKKLTNLHCQDHGKPPPWLDAFGDIELLPVPHWRRFKAVDEETGIELRGVPDIIFREKNGTYGIVDHKTAKLSPAQETMRPVYQVQLSCYAWIGERCGLKPVETVGLVYFEPRTDFDEGELAGLLSNAGMKMSFRATAVPVDLKLDLIPKLLRRAQQIADMQEPPEGKEECKDCEAMNAVYRLLGCPTAAA